MFQHPFSFEGRIRRLEYGISFIIYLPAYLFELILFRAGAQSTVLAIIMIIPSVWFFWAQGSKRCHDIGRSGWMQIIPFYFLFLLFENGEPGENDFGQNPKDQQAREQISDTLDGNLKI